jgi:phosphoenolpyruvate carboxylase
VQSAFKFDHPVEEVRAACEHLKSREIGPPTPVDTKRALSVIERYSNAYRARVVELAPHINRMAKHVPARRARKLHIGLFGYARELGGVTLPRAISFTCALYSLGLPPELIAFDALTPEDRAFVHEVYPSFEAKVADALAYADLDGPLMEPGLRRALLDAGFEVTPNEEHLALVRAMRAALDEGQPAHVPDLLLRAALMRRFLG